MPVLYSEIGSIVSHQASTAIDYAQAKIRFSAAGGATQQHGSAFQLDATRMNLGFK